MYTLIEIRPGEQGVTTGCHESGLRNQSLDRNGPESENLRKKAGRFRPVPIPATNHCFNWHQRNRILESLKDLDNLKPHLRFEFQNFGLASEDFDRWCESYLISDGSLVVSIKICFH